MAHAHLDALDFYAQALTVCARLGDETLATVVSVSRKRGDVHLLTLHTHEALGDYNQMAEVARRLGDRHLEGLALAFRGYAEKEHHAFEQAEATLRAALAIGKEGYDDAHCVAALQLSLCLAVVGRKAEAEATLQEAGEWARQRGDATVQLAYDAGTIFFSIWDGRFDDALATSARWNAADAARNIADIVGGRWQEALARGGKGEYEHALALLHAIIETCDRTSEAWTWRRALNTLGWLYGELQDHQRALKWNTLGVQAVRERGAPESIPENENNARLNLADTFMALGRLDEAEAELRHVERMVRTPQPQDWYMLWRYAQHYFHSYGELWLARGDPERALRYADECIALAETTTSRKNIVKGRRLRGQALLAQGRLAEAEQELDTALQMAQQVGNPFQTWTTYVALGDVRQAQGRDQEAQAAYHAALAVIGRVATALSDTTLRDTFLTSAQVQHIRHAALSDPAQVERLSAAGGMDPQSRVVTVGSHPGLDGQAWPGSRKEARASATPVSRGQVSRRERQAWALERLQTVGPLSPRAYAGALGVSVDTALRDLQQLVDQGLVLATGRTKNRRYTLAGERAGPAIRRTGV
jgi:tetratricopeptide (TPR) repeat protein